MREFIFISNACGKFYRENYLLLYLIPKLDIIGDSSSRKYHKSFFKQIEGSLKPGAGGGTGPHVFHKVACFSTFV